MISWLNMTFVNGSGSTLEELADVQTIDTQRQYIAMDD
jgi:hypothetical protein